MNNEEEALVSDDILSCLLTKYDEEGEVDDSISVFTASDELDSVELCTIKIAGKKQNTIVVVKSEEDRIVPKSYRDKNRKRKRAKLEKVEVVRVDVRNTFALMMANVYNTLDFNQIYGMLRTYSIPDASFSMNRTKGDVFSVNFNGPFMMANALYSNLSIYPDCVTSLLSSGFDPVTGIIAYTLEFRMTKLYSYKTIVSVLPSMAVEASPPASSAGCTSDSKSEEIGHALSDDAAESKVVEKVSEMMESLPLRSKPVVMIVQAKVVLRTNEHKRIVEGRVTLTTIKND